jgi:uncharacterized membrane protein
MRAVTVLMYLALGAILVTVIMTATSSGRIDWDESAVILIPLAVLVVVLAFVRGRSASRPGV